MGSLASFFAMRKVPRKRRLPWFHGSFLAKATMMLSKLHGSNIEGLPSSTRGLCFAHSRRKVQKIDSILEHFLEDSILI